MAQSCSGVKTTVLPPSFDSDTPPNLSIMPTPGMPVDPPTGSTGTEWISSPCNPKARYRYTDDGHVEIEGEGVVLVQNFPKQVADFAELIAFSADDAGISRALLAGLVATESGGNPNAVSTTGRLGLTQIPRELAKMVANPDFPKDKTPVELTDAQIMQPAFNLAHGAKALAHFLAVKNYNLVAALAMYDHGQVQCEPNPECKTNRWNLWTECGYIDQVIYNTNFAVQAGFAGPRQVDLGGGDVDGDEGDGSNLATYLMFGALGAGLAFAASTMWKGSKQR